MENPMPIHLSSDDQWREFGWPAIARDADGHVISSCAGTDGPAFNEWLRKCFDAGWTVTDLRRHPRREADPS